RQLGFPTSNLGGVDVEVPADGVYAGRADLPDVTSRASAIHVGPNVTFGADERTVEAFLIDFDGDLYGQTLEVDLLERLRPTVKFDGVEALLAQMRRDVERARQVVPLT